MGRFLKRGGVFLAATTMLYVAAMALMVHVPVLGEPAIYRANDYFIRPGGSTWTRYREFDPKGRYDAVIIGSSHAYLGYDPYVVAERGYRAFNLGSDAQSPLCTYWLVKAYLDSVNTPLLIMDLFDEILQGEALEGASDLIQNQPSDAAAAGIAWSLHDLRGMNMLALRLLARPERPLYGSPLYKGLGFCTTGDSIKTEAGPPPADPMPLRADQKHFTEQIIRLCSERGIKLVLSSHFERRDKRGRAHEGMLRYLPKALAGSGIPYLDFTNAPGIDDRNWFEDNNHLNATGARIFTEQLVDTLEALGYLHSLK
ncbi:MAG: hypothetical protein JSS84_12895 [Bacteroidetes bacterium]|nr:hypothetical protein [Bacteroidota bacterium]